MVCQLLRKHKSDPDFLRSLVDEDIQERNVKGILRNTIERLLLDNQKLHNAAMIQKEIDQQHHLEIPMLFIQRTLKEEFEMKWKRVKKIPHQANSTRNLYMRQRFGKLMIDQLHEGKRILNVDETWIG